ncbi:MAG TPA: heme exporter protein CcmB [Acidobacteriota bacterium]|jgi:heme exporter protein B
MREGLNAALAILRKDLVLEVRSREGFLSNLFFALLVLILFNFGFDPGSAAIVEGKAAIFWIAVVFASALTLSRTFQRESAESAIHALALLPLDPAWIFVGKFLTNFCVILLLMTLTLPLFIIFFDVSVSWRMWLLAAVCPLAAAGMAAVGTLFGAMAESTRLREVVVSILLYPIIVPLLIASVQLMRQALKLTGEIENWHWMGMMVVFDLIFFAAALVVFDYVLGE